MKMKPEEMKTVVKQKQEDFSDLLKVRSADNFTPKFCQCLLCCESKTLLFNCTLVFRSNCIQHT